MTTIAHTMKDPIAVFQSSSKIISLLRVSLQKSK